HPTEVRREENADRRLRVWLLPPQGGEPQQLTDEPLGVEAFRFARAADRLVVLAPVLPAVPPDQQRSRASERRKHGPCARRLLRQPVRHWDHWLDDGVASEATHVIAYQATPAGPAGARGDLAPAAAREVAGDPEVD